MTKPLLCWTTQQDFNQLRIGELCARVSPPDDEDDTKTELLGKSLIFVVRT